MAEFDYDLVVLGSGPGGQKAAIAAAKLGHRAAVVERRHMLGGVCINTGTVPSKTLREAVLYLTGLNMRDLYGQSYRVKADITIQDLLSRTQHVIGREVEVVRSQLFRNGVQLVHGTGRFLRHPQPRGRARVDGRGRRRGDRRRVRIDVRGAGVPRDPGRAAGPDARLLRLGDRGGAEVPPA